MNKQGLFPKGCLWQVLRYNLLKYSIQGLKPFLNYNKAGLLFSLTNKIYPEHEQARTFPEGMPLARPAL